MNMMTKEAFFINGLKEGKNFAQINKEWAASPYAIHKEKSVKHKLEDAVLTGVVYDRETCDQFIDDNGTDNDKKHKPEYFRQVSFALRAAELGIKTLTEMRNRA